VSQTGWKFLKSELKADVALFGLFLVSETFQKALLRFHSDCQISKNVSTSLFLIFSSHESLKKLKPGAIPKINAGKLPFHRLENLSNFLGWVRSTGIEDRNSFVSVDLHDEKAN
jgi:hypothetical protein